MNKEYSEEEVSALFQSRLMSVFSLAEQHIINCLDKPNDERIVALIRQKKTFFQTRFLRYIVLEAV
ncbi:hypothetical protein GCM10027190_34410 [Spirosoma areae]